MNEVFSGFPMINKWNKELTRHEKIPFGSRNKPEN